MADTLVRRYFCRVLRGFPRTVAGQDVHIR